MEQGKLTIIEHSNSVAVGTGYGVQSALMIPAWQDLGHKVIQSGFYGNQGAPVRISGEKEEHDLLILPTSKDAYGNDVLIDDFRHWNADITITLIDAWIFNPNVTSQIRWVPYYPVDTDPMPPFVAQVLRTAYKLIAYAKFGVEKSIEAGFKNVLYVPHMVDTAFYRPIDRVEARKELGLQEDRLDWFVASIVAANKGYPSRKAFDQQIRAFAEFHRMHPRSLLALHTDVWGGHDGEDIMRIAELAGLKPEFIALPPKYQFQRGMIGPDYLRRLYNASDVLMNVTRGEGFGVPIIEAMSCGVPALVTDATAMPELVDAGAGYKVKVADKFYYQNVYQFTPSVDSIIGNLEQAYADKQSGKLTEMGKQARDGMVREYDANLVAEKYWKPTLELIAGELADAEAKKSARADKRAALRANGAKHE
jgi:glycosyltransferase involved in cell wall biosynthesis